MWFIVTGTRIEFDWSCFRDEGPGMWTAMRLLRIGVALSVVSNSGGVRFGTHLREACCAGGVDHRKVN